ncbi:unnamed protein product, partial [Discosporangium mesarthrocarpum]
MGSRLGSVGAGVQHVQGLAGVCQAWGWLSVDARAVILGLVVGLPVVILGLRWKRGAARKTGLDGQGREEVHLRDLPVEYDGVERRTSRHTINFGEAANATAPPHRRTSISERRPSMRRGSTRRTSVFDVLTGNIPPSAGEEGPGGLPATRAEILGGEDRGSAGG